MAGGKPAVEMLIDGRFREGPDMRAVVNPADGKPFVDAAMTHEALAAAHIKVLRHGLETPDWRPMQHFTGVNDHIAHTTCHQARCLHGASNGSIKKIGPPHGRVARMTGFSQLRMA